MRNTPRQARVFVSSAIGELAAERSAAQSVIKSLRLIPVMQNSEPGNDPGEQRSVADSRDIDAFVGIYWQSCGSIVPGSKRSALEEELRLAGDRPRLIYVKEPSPDRDPRLASLIEEIVRSSGGVARISGPEDLADRLTEDLARLLFAGPNGDELDLPTGTVTFLFADVEGSTETLERFGDVYGDLLARFLRDGETLVGREGGRLVKKEGDGFFAVFPLAEAALRAAIAAQRTYLSYPSPGPIMVRVGLHSGTGVVVDREYAGIDVHRAARVGSVAHGSQIIISASTRELITRWEGASTTDMGWYRLKGLSRPEHLHQVAAAGLPADFPPLRGALTSRAQLPRQLTSLLGREDDIERIASLLGAKVRLLTLTGPGGIGKSRLAAAAADRVEAQFRDGIGFVSLEAVTDPDRVADTIAAALGRTIEGTASAEDVVADELRDRRFLLILDNFEQVVECAPLLRSLLERLPQLQSLVTSRIALQLSMEKEYEVRPLGLPAAGAPPNEVAEAAAVRLLLDRARAVRPDLSVTTANATAVADLVRRLDGIPLAIELAAARLRLLEPADVLKRLASVLGLGAGAVDLPARQRTLRAAIDWSFHLLAPAERTLFARLGIFVDGWTLEAAEAVAAGEEVSDVATTLDTLAAHSLIRPETIPGAGVRMRMLGPLHDYALAVLGESGEGELLRSRHAQYFGHKVEDYPRGSGVGLADWQRRMRLEWGNIRQAINWCVDRSEFNGLAGFLTSLWPLLWQEDRVEETLKWLEVLRPNISDLPPEVAARVQHVDGFFALETGDFARAVESGREALEAATALGDEELRGQSMLLLAGGLPAFDLEDPDTLGYIDEAIRIFRRRGDTVNLAYALNFLCSYQAVQGDVAAAREAIEEALLIASDIEALPVEAQSSTALAFVDLISGDLDGAEEHLAAAVKALDLTPNREVLSYALDGYGWWALAQGREIAGLTALGAAEGLRARVGLRVWPLTAAQVSLLSRWADSYEDPEAQAARRAGRELTPEAALAVVTSSSQHD